MQATTTSTWMVRDVQHYRNNACVEFLLGVMLDGGCAFAVCLTDSSHPNGLMSSRALVSMQIAGHSPGEVEKASYKRIPTGELPSADAYHVSALHLVRARLFALAAGALHGMQVSIWHEVSR
jgi:hypothetical protein